MQRYVPALLPGLAGAALHPLIHLGLGLEYALSSWAGESRDSVAQPLFIDAARARLKAHPSGDVGENLWFAR